MSVLSRIKIYNFCSWQFHANHILCQFSSLHISQFFWNWRVRLHQPSFWKWQTSKLSNPSYFNCLADMHEQSTYAPPFSLLSDMLEQTGSQFLVIGHPEQFSSNRRKQIPSLYCSECVLWHRPSCLSWSQPNLRLFCEAAAAAISSGPMLISAQVRWLYLLRSNAYIRSLWSLASLLSSTFLYCVVCFIINYASFKGKLL